MSIITRENLLKKVRDHFELVMLAAQRTKDLYAGSKPTIDRNNDKNTVLAMREIESGSVIVDELKSSLILNNQENVPIVLDKSEDEELLAIEREINGEVEQELEEVQELISDDLAFGSEESGMDIDEGADE